MSDEKIEPKTVKIEVLETRGESSLVQWKNRGIVRRGYVQSDSIDDCKALQDVLDYALPVGPDPMSLDVRKFTKLLRQRNIWTAADFRSRDHSVIRSLLEAMKV